MTFPREQIATSSPVTGEQFNHSDDTILKNVTVSSRVSYQPQPADTASSIVTNFHRSANTSSSSSSCTSHASQHLETAITHRRIGTANKKSEFAAIKSNIDSPSSSVISPSIRRLTSYLQTLSVNEQEGSQQSQRLRDEEIRDFEFSLYQSCNIKSRKLSRLPPSKINYNFQLLQECFHLQLYSIIKSQLNAIDITTLNECALDHYDFIAGLYYLKFNSTAEAKQHFEAIIKRERSNDTLYLQARSGSLMQAYYYLGDIQLLIGNVGDAASSYQAAINVYPLCIPLICNTFKIKHVRASAIYRKLGECKAIQKNIISAIDSYQQGVEVATSLKDKMELINAIGNTLQLYGLLNKSIICYRMYLNFAEKLDDKKGLEYAYNNLGTVYAGIQQFGQALDCYTKSLQLTLQYQRTNHAAISQIYRNLGTVYQAMNNYEQAKFCYFNAALEANILNDNDAKACALGNLGNIYTLQHNYVSAIKQFEEVIILTSDHRVKNIAMHNKGGAQHDLAKSKLQNALTTHQNITLSEFSHLTINLDPYFQCLQTYSDDAEVICANTLLLAAASILKDVIKFRFSHIPNTIARYNHELLKPVLKKHVRTLIRLQDCLLLLGDYAAALEVAEQARETCILNECRVSNEHSSTDFSTVTFPLDYSQIVDAIKSSKRPTSFLSFTGRRLAIWFHNPMQDDISIKTYVFPSNEHYLTKNTFAFFKEILNSHNGINRLITQKLTSDDRFKIEQQSITAEQIFNLIKSLKPFISQIESVLPSLDAKQSMLWIT